MCRSIRSIKATITMMLVIVAALAVCADGFEVPLTANFTAPFEDAMAAGTANFYRFTLNLVIGFNGPMANRTNPALTAGLSTSFSSSKYLRSNATFRVDGADVQPFQGIAPPAITTTISWWLAARSGIYGRGHYVAFYGMWINYTALRPLFDAYNKSMIRRGPGGGKPVVSVVWGLLPEVVDAVGMKNAVNSSVTATGGAEVRGSRRLTVRSLAGATYTQCHTSCIQNGEVLAWIMNKQESDFIDSEQDRLGVKEAWIALENLATGTAGATTGANSVLCWTTHPKYQSAASCNGGDETLLYRGGTCRNGYFCGKLTNNEINDGAGNVFRNDRNYNIWRDRGRADKMNGCVCLGSGVAMTAFTATMPRDAIVVDALTPTSSSSVSTSKSWPPTVSPTNSLRASRTPQATPSRQQSSSLSESAGTPSKTPSQSLVPPTSSPTVSISPLVEFIVPRLAMIAPAQRFVYRNFLTVQANATGAEGPEASSARRVEITTSAGQWNCAAVRADIRYLFYCDGAVGNLDVMEELLPRAQVNCNGRSLVLQLQRSQRYSSREVRSQPQAASSENCTVHFEDLQPYLFARSDIDARGVRLVASFDVREAPVPAPPPVAPVVAQSAKSTAQASAVVASAAGNPAMAVQAARTAMILTLAECSDDSAIQGPDFMSHPTGIAVGNGTGAPYAGAAVGNPMIMVCSIGLHFFVVWARAEYDGDRGRGEILQKYAAKFHFPSLQVIIILPLLQPTVTAVVTAAREGTDAWQFVCAVVGAAFIAVFSLYVTWLTTRKMMCTFYTFEDLGVRVNPIAVFFIGNGEFRDNNSVPPEVDERRRLRLEREREEAEQKKNATADVTKKAAETDTSQNAVLAVPLVASGAVVGEGEAATAVGGLITRDAAAAPIHDSADFHHVSSWLATVNVPTSGSEAASALDVLLDEHLLPAGHGDDPAAVALRRKKEHEQADADRKLAANFYEKYFLFFDMYREGRSWFCSAEIVATIGFGIVEGWRPKSLLGCRVLIGFMLLLFVGFVVAIVRLRPFVTRYDESFSLTNSFFQVLGSVATLAYAIGRDQRALAVAEWAATVAMYLLGAKAMGDLALMTYDFCLRRVKEKIEDTIATKLQGLPSAAKKREAEQAAAAAARARNAAALNTFMNPLAELRGAAKAAPFERDAAATSNAQQQEQQQQQQQQQQKRQTQRSFIDEWVAETDASPNKPIVPWK